ncbi:MAG: hypothetical protein LBM98_07220 [Oscillospiraceae bacterium]|nr:hypothetical protein [Oscillospiraceae bacterium]
MLRTCNRVRIASVPVLRNDGGGRFADTEETVARDFGASAVVTPPHVRCPRLTFPPPHILFL